MPSRRCGVTWGLRGIRMRLAHYDVVDAIIAARAEENLTQRELAQRCGMKQSAFARLESGNANPTIETLQRVAEGLGKKLRISFV